jgi:tetratricopeptide (TPR) repeat protein
MVITRRHRIILASLATALLAFAIGGIVFATFYVASWYRGIDSVQKTSRAVTAAKWKDAYDFATAALEQHLSNHDRATVFFLRGVASNRLNRFDDGIRDLNQAILLEDKAAQVYSERGFAFVRTTRLDEADSDLSEAVKLDSNLGWAYYNRGWIRMSREKWKEAIWDFSEAIRCQPDMVAAICNRAACYEAQRNYDAALADYDSVLLLDPGNAKAHAGRGSVLRARGDLNQLLGSSPPTLAALTFDTQLFGTSRPTPPPILPPIDLTTAQQRTRGSELYAKAKEAEAMGNFEGAIDYYGQALALNFSPHANSVTHMNRGNIYLKMKEEDRALADYDAAIRDDPANAGAYVNRGDVLGRRQMREKAIADYATALWLNPNQAEAYHNRAVEYLRKGEIDAAIHDLNSAIELKPDLCESYLKRAAAYARKGDVARQLADLEIAAKTETHCQQTALNSLAWLRATSRDAAVRDGRRAIELATQACERGQWSNPSHIDTLAAAYAEAGDFESAIKFDQMAIAHLRSDSDSREGYEKRLNLFQSRQPYREDQTKTVASFSD